MSDPKTPADVPSAAGGWSGRFSEPVTEIVKRYTAKVDLAGRLVGINTAIYSRSGGSQGIGFAIPVNMVQVVVASAKGGSTAVRRPVTRPPQPSRP